MKEVDFGVSLTQPQRDVIAELFPQMVNRLKLDVNHQVKIVFTVSQMKAILWCAGEAVPITTSGTKRTFVALYHRCLSPGNPRCSRNRCHCTIQTSLSIQNHSAGHGPLNLAAHPDERLLGR